MLQYRRSRCSSNDNIAACEDDFTIACPTLTTSSAAVSGGKRQRVEDAIPQPGDQELSAIECPWCQRGKLFIWTNTVLQFRGVGRPFPTHDVAGPVVCTYGGTCASSSLRAELMKNLMLTGGGGLTIEDLHWKISAAVRAHVLSCNNTTTHHHNIHQQSMPAADAAAPAVLSDSDAASLYRCTMRLAVVARRIGDPAVAEFAPHGGSVTTSTIAPAAAMEVVSGLLPPMLFYFLRCSACNTEDFIA
jgi:hypothetical protein